MTLDEYMKSKNISVAQMAEKVQVSEQTIYKYLSGERTPHRSIMPRIIQATDGIVDANSFVIIPNSTNLPQQNHVEIGGKHAEK